MKKIIWSVVQKIMPEEFPHVYNRLKIAIFDKKKLLKIERTEIFADHYNSNAWLSSESRSGGGSTLVATKIIRSELELLIETLSIKTMCDVPCGDWNWMKEVNLSNVKYLGCDIVSEIIIQLNSTYSRSNIEFRRIDICEDILPKVDLIFCRDCLQHLSYGSVFRAISNFKKSGSKYLLVTSYPLTLINHDISDGDYRPLNLLRRPFSLKRPMMKIAEFSNEVDVELDKTMYLFLLDDINVKFNG